MDKKENIKKEEKVSAEYELNISRAYSDTNEVNMSKADSNTNSDSSIDTGIDTETDSKKKNGKKESSGWKSELISWIQIVVSAFLIAFVLNNFIIANSKVPTGSMEPTIMSHDRVIGSRLSYTFGEPERGDIAIFKFGWICNRCKRAMGEAYAPEICPYCGKEITRAKTLYYVKRVIGMPGDVIEIKAEGSIKASELSEIPPGIINDPGADPELVTAAVYVNGEKLKEDYVTSPMLYTGDMEFEVPEGSYFFLGDNRNNSKDARYWNDPYIEEDEIIAKVMFRYFPKPSVLK